MPLKKYDCSQFGSLIERLLREEEDDGVVSKKHRSNPRASLRTAKRRRREPAVQTEELVDFLSDSEFELAKQVVDDIAFRSRNAAAEVEDRPEELLNTRTQMISSSKFQRTHDMPSSGRKPVKLRLPAREHVGHRATASDDVPKPRRAAFRRRQLAAIPPEASFGCPREPAVCPPTTLKVSMYTTSCRHEGWQGDAFDIFAEHGFVVVEHVLALHQCSAVLRDCERVAEEIVGHGRRGNRGPGRYSFGKASSSGSMLHVPSFARHLLGNAGRMLRPLLDRIFFNGERPGFSCLSASGDFVLGDVHTHQALHADIQVPRELQKKLPPPYIAVNFCVQELTPMNGATRIIPGTHFQSSSIPDPEPEEWRRSRLCPIPAGAAIIRDIRVLHGGTPNFTQDTRYLPNVE